MNFSITKQNYTYMKTMRKILMLMLMVVSGLCARAEQYDEVNLLGAWEVTERVGESAVISAFERNYQMNYLYIGEMEQTYYDYGTDEEITEVDWDVCGYPSDTIPPNGYWAEPAEDSSAGGNGNELMDFFISNGNKLHLQFEHGTLRFIIESFTDSELKLMTYDKKFRMTLKRISSPNKVAEVNAASAIPNGIYDLNGTAVKNPEKGIYVVKTDKETSKRLIR